MFLQGCFQALTLSTHRSIIGVQHMVRTAALIHLGVISSVAHLAHLLSALSPPSAFWYQVPMFATDVRGVIAWRMRNGGALYFGVERVAEGFL
jgi:hypothetical protein